MIKINNISFSYSKNNALSNVSLTIEKNQVFGLIGVNGSGKTTLIKMILKILSPNSGRIDNQFFGQIGVVMEYPGMFPDMSVEKNLNIAAIVKGIDCCQNELVLQKVGLFEKRKSKVKNLSLGMTQRLSIASALLANPELLILDEPTNGLDPIAIVEMRQLIQQIAEDGKTIIIASHLLTEIEQICSHIAIIDKGKILIDGSLNEVLDNYPNLETAFVYHINKNQQ